MSGARRTGLSVAGRKVISVLGVLLLAVLAAACEPQPVQLAAQPSASRSAPDPTGSVRPVANTGSASAQPISNAIGTAGTFQVDRHTLVLAEPAHAGVAGKRIGPRTLFTQLWYPTAARAAGSASAKGQFPLVLFAPGFMLCANSYADLLTSWASAGFVVAAVNFPHSDCVAGAAATESDLVNQPADLSYALNRLLAMSSLPGNLLSGLIDPHEIAAAGHSDGGDTTVALGANTCCTDHRVAAVAVLSGAEWPAMLGRYFAAAAPPMLFVQGSADTINPPWASRQLYNADVRSTSYYLDLHGADHLVPYQGTNKFERLVAQITLAFFDRYVLGQASAASAMIKDASAGGRAATLLAHGPAAP